MNGSLTGLPRLAMAVRGMRTLVAARAVLLYAACGFALFGCHRGEWAAVPADPAAPPAPPPPPSPVVEAWDGYFIGSVTVTTGFPQSGEAVLTPDGTVRIAFKNSWGGLHPEGSAQFVGTFDVLGTEGLGTGFVIGQECAVFPANRFCIAPASARITIFTATQALLGGQLEVSTSEGDEIWPFQMYWYGGPLVVSLPGLVGIYEAHPIEFAQGNLAMIVTVDIAGLMYFQSPNSGCIGNGALTPYGDGAFPAFAAALTIEACNGEFSKLNGTYEGLVIGFPSDFYYFASLSLWMSTSTEAGSQAAFTMDGEA